MPGRVLRSQPPAPVQLGAIRFELRFVGHGADQRMVEHVVGLSGESDLVDELAATKSSTTGSTPRVSSRSWLNREPITAAALKVRLAAGSRRSMRAAMVACKVAGTLTSASLGGRVVGARLPLQHTPLGQVAHDLLGEKRVPGGPLGDHGGPAPPTEGSDPSSSETSAAVSGSLSGARAMV